MSSEHLSKSVQLLIGAMMLVGALPLLDELDWRIGGVLIAVLAWRAAVSSGRVSPIRAWEKVAVVIVALATVRWVFNSLWSLDSLVSLILVLWTAKFLELQRIRDAYVLILLNYFVIFCLLLYSQTLVTVSFALVSAIWGLSLLIRLHLKQWRVIWQLLRVLVPMSFLLAALMFALLPAAGAFWKIPLQRDSAVSGLSDRVSPGDIADLVKSNETAFRVESLNGLWPAPRDRYWRAIVLDWFDGRAWRASQMQAQSTVPSALCESSGEAYRLIIEPHYQPWLFTLDGFVSDDPTLRYMSNHTLRTTLPVSQRTDYRICPRVNQVREPLMNRERYLYLGDSNPRARAWGEQLQSLPTTEAKVSEVLKHFHDNSIYTLSPGTLDEDALDEFLFDDPRGFCEHFASSFAFVMRAAGVPSRVVVGYQGGELSPVADYMRVAESDAHAWTEIWYEDHGWRRVDPTAYVAPQRIEMGFSQDNGSTWLASEPWYEFSNSATWRAWVLRLDAVNYTFANWVSSFDNQSRQSWMSSWLGGSDWWRSVAVIAFFVLGVSAIGVFWQRWRSRPRYSAAVKQYQRAENKVAKLFRKRSIGETPRRYLSACEAKLHASHAAAVQLAEAIDELERLEYQAVSD